VRPPASVRFAAIVAFGTNIDGLRKVLGLPRTVSPGYRPSVNDADPLARLSAWTNLTLRIRSSAASGVPRCTITMVVRERPLLPFCDWCAGTLSVETHLTCQCFRCGKQFQSGKYVGRYVIEVCDECYASN